MKSEHAKEKMTVARYLTSLIERLDVDIIPVIQGGVIMKMIDEVGISEKLKHICPNHEQALAMMVDTYSRIKGFGVGMVTSGPGAVNLATGIACSFYDSIPCLYISGQVGNFHVKRERNVRQRGFQETDVVEVLKPITKYSVLLDDPNDARYIFEKAVFMAKSGRPGPVLIDLPYDVQRSLVVPKLLRAFELPKTDINNEKLYMQYSNNCCHFENKNSPSAPAPSSVSPNSYKSSPPPQAAASRQPQNPSPRSFSCHSDSPKQFRT